MTTFDYSNCPISRWIAICGVFIVLLVCMSIVPLSAQQPPPAINWNAFKFLVGEWVGEGTGAPGEGSGGFTFSYDLQSTVLVRKNYANYPATRDRPAFTHDDLMIVYQEAGNTRAVYFDNEQHVINYSVTLATDSNSIVFVSDAVPSTPRFRLTNTKAGTDKITITFEIAPPGKPESFTRYIEASARRKK
jgi:hypothetical protein